MRLIENGREIGEVKHFHEHEVRMGGEPRTLCEFEVIGDISGDGPLWLEDDGGEWHIDITSARSGVNASGQHWRVEAEISTRH